MIDILEFVFISIFIIVFFGVISTGLWLLVYLSLRSIMDKETSCKDQCKCNEQKGTRSRGKSRKN